MPGNFKNCQLLKYLDLCLVVVNCAIIHCFVFTDMGLEG